jgi:hypothetical protein
VDRRSAEGGVAADEEILGGKEASDSEGLKRHCDFKDSAINPEL